LVILIIIVVLILLLGARAYLSYRRHIRANRERVRGASHMAETASGPIEYAENGGGAPALIVHGAGGGFDQGMELGRALARRGFKVIPMSRFGYLRTPLTADPSAAAQADAHEARCIHAVASKARAERLVPFATFKPRFPYHARHARA